MSCGCKTNKQIRKKKKKYGDNIPQSKASNIRGSVAVFAKEALVAVILIPIYPILLFSLIFTGASKKRKPIDINKTFKIVN